MLTKTPPLLIPLLWKIRHFTAPFGTFVKVQLVVVADVHSEFMASWPTSAPAASYHSMRFILRVPPCGSRSALMSTVLSSEAGPVALVIVT